MKQFEEWNMLQREDALSHLLTVSVSQKEWQAQVTTESQHEIMRLQEELSKARRIESQRDREIAFLQRQLLEAANRLRSNTDNNNSDSQLHHNNHDHNQNNNTF
jgi:hypothetical protein